MEQVLFFETAREFHTWLQKHHDLQEGAWLLFYKDGRPAMTLVEAQEEAACFGWVDSLLKRIDDTRYRLRFTPRRKKSRWSPGTKKTAQELIASGRMTPWGLAAIEEAKASGAWDAPDPRQALEDPEGFLRVLGKNREASRQYAALTDSLRKHYAGYYFAARQEATREKRLRMILESMKTKKRILG
jgi:uncharacterized protein YdeI (YjbR/CyaY-like superfamily)